MKTWEIYEIVASNLDGKWENLLSTLIGFAKLDSSVKGTDILGYTVIDILKNAGVTMFDYSDVGTLIGVDAEEHAVYVFNRDDGMPLYEIRRM